MRKGDGGDGRWGMGENDGLREEMVLEERNKRRGEGKRREQGEGGAGGGFIRRLLVYISL